MGLQLMSHAALAVAQAQSLQAQMLLATHVTASALLWSHAPAQSQSLAVRVLHTLKVNLHLLAGVQGSCQAAGYSIVNEAMSGSGP